MIFKTSPLAAFTLILSACILPSCGDAVDEDTPPNPAEPVDVALDYERDDIAVPTDANPEDPSSCNADLAQPFVGRTVDLDVRSQLLETIAPIVNVKWLTPDDTLTGGSENPRMVVRMDGESMITSIACE